MKLVRSLILGSAAALAGVAGANAADLPPRKVAAVEYVRVCSTYGEGFFFIPGTESCVRIGGRARADCFTPSPSAAHRTPSASAPAAVSRSTSARPPATACCAPSFASRSPRIRAPSARNGSFANSVDVAQAFVQFGGLTAGKVTSFFDNPDLPTEHFGTLRFSDAPDVPVLAYTFSFGTGFSATLSPRRRPDPPGRHTAVLVRRDRPPGFRCEQLRRTDRSGSRRQRSLCRHLGFGSALGRRAPEPRPGRERLCARHRVRLCDRPAGRHQPAVPAAGDTAWFAATYTDGALGYLGFSSETTAGHATGLSSDIFTFADANTSEARGWSLAGGVTHNWTPTLRSSLFGSWADVNFSGAVTAGFGTRTSANTASAPIRSGLRSRA